MTQEPVPNGEPGPQEKQAVTDRRVAERPAPEWKEYRLLNSAAVVQFPATPIQRRQKIRLAVDQPEVAVNGYRLTMAKGTVLLSFNESTLPSEMKGKKEKLDALTWAEKNTIATVVAGKSNASRKIQYKNHPGREYRYDFIFTDPRTQKDTKWSSITVNYIVGQKFYELSAIQHADRFDETLARRFLDSFRLIDPADAEKRDRNPN